MGVRGLESYMYDNYCITDVNIKSLVDEYKETNDDKPVIVVDLYRLDQFVCSSMDWSHGGNLKEYENRLDRFFRCFQDIGVDLLLFAYGIKTIPALKFEDEFDKNFDYIRTTIESVVETSRARPQRRGKPPALYPSTAGEIMKILSSKYPFKFIRTSRKSEVEIAQYCNQNKILALLAQDSDFIIFEFDGLYLSMKDFNIDTMTTSCFDKKKLLSRLNLPAYQLPLFGSLVGNGIVYYEWLWAFHRSLHNGSYDPKRNIDYVARFIKNWTGSIEKMNTRVFKHSRIDELLRSIEIYKFFISNTRLEFISEESTGHWHEVQTFIKEQYMQLKQNEICLEVAFKSKVLCRNLLDCFPAEEGYKSSAELTKKIRQAIYGILLQEKNSPPDKTHLVEEIFLSRTSVEAKLPKVPHEGLKKLWNTDESLNEQRFNLFFDSLGINNLCSVVESHLIIPTSTIKYLLNEGFVIEEWEMGAMVASMVLLDQYTIEQLNDIPQVVVDSHAMNLFISITQSISKVIELNNVCGFPVCNKAANPSRYQDGKLFYHKYNEAKEKYVLLELCEDQENVVEIVTNIITYLLESNN